MFPIRAKSRIALLFLAGIQSFATVHDARGQGNPASPRSDYPSRPVRLIQPTPPGGTSDAVARVLARKLGEKWGWQVVVDNRSGAHGVIATQIAIRSQPDGYTLLNGNVGTVAINATLYPKLSYDPLKDLQPISQVSEQPHVIFLSAAVPAATLSDLIRLARSIPKKMHFASGGNGSGTHLGPELLFKEAKVSIVHVPYRGGGAALAAVASNEAQVMFTPLVAAHSLLAQGRIRAVAVTGERRLAALKDVPTLAEQGYARASYTAWTGLLAPAGIPRALLMQLHADIAGAVNSPEMAGWLEKSGAAASTSRSPEDFHAFIRTEIARWGGIIKATGARLE